MFKELYAKIVSYYHVNILVRICRFKRQNGIMLLKAVAFFGLLILSVYILHPGRYARRYDYIDNSNILNEVQYETKIVPKHNLKKCDYSKIINNRVFIHYMDVYKTRNHSDIINGGEYVPKNCNTEFSVAVIVPYRKREEQLKTFLNYFHYYLQAQDIHYRIYIVNQLDDKPFNRAKLLNIGAVVAMRDNFPCLILHDVDLIPLNSGNMYVCSKKPRHMSCNLDTFRFNLPYLGIVGGAVTILSEQFQFVNGMSNLFFGWGGEDDDFFIRLDGHNLTPCRFSPELSRYIMLRHKKEKPSEKRHEMLRSGEKRVRIDGLNSINSSYTVHLLPLFTRIDVTSI